MFKTIGAAIRAIWDKATSSATFLQLSVLALAGPVLTIIIEQVVLLVANGHWAVAQQPEQLEILKVALLTSQGLLAIVLVAMTAGLIKGVKFTLPGGTSAEIDLDDDDSNSSPPTVDTSNPPPAPVANT